MNTIIIKDGQDAVCNELKLKSKEISELNSYQNNLNKCKKYYHSLVKRYNLEDRPYQAEYAALYASRRKNVCALSLGLGKTFIAGLTIKCLYQDRLEHNLTTPGQVQIAAPSDLSIRSRWIVELQRLALGGYIEYINSEKQLLESTAPIWLYTHDFLKRKSRLTNLSHRNNRNTLDRVIKKHKRMPSFLVVDEGHQLKEGTKRTESFKYVMGKARRVLLISGTVTDGKLDLIHQLCNLVYGKHWPYDKSKKFREKFSKKNKLKGSYLYGSNIREEETKKELYTLKPSVAPEFAKLIQRFIHRASYNDPNIYPHVKIPSREDRLELVTPVTEHKKHYKEVIDTNREAIDRAKEYGRLSSTNVAKALRLLNPVLTASNTPAAGIKNNKLNKLLELVTEYTQLNKKTAIFCSAVAAANLVTNTLLSNNINTIRVYSKDPHYSPPSQSLSERSKALDQFMFNPDTLAGVFSINLASESIDLTTAEQLIFYDYTWSSIKIQQSLFRVIRPGSIADSVRVVYLANKGFIDEYQYKLLLNKILNSHSLIDFDVESLKVEDLDVSDLLKYL